MFTAEKYNGTPKQRTYKIVYEDGVTAQRYADEEAYVEISFSAEDYKAH